MPEFLLNSVQGDLTWSPLFPWKQRQKDRALPQSQTGNPSSLFESPWGFFSLVLNLTLISNIKKGLDPICKEEIKTQM